MSPLSQSLKFSQHFTLYGLNDMHFFNAVMFSNIKRALSN